MSSQTTVALLICSDRAAAGTREDKTAAGLRAAIHERGYTLATVELCADERPQIERRLRELASRHRLVLTSGGTGIGPRDVTVEATLDVIDREIVGMGEAMRQASLAHVPTAMLSRATAGTFGSTLIVNLPGSPKGAKECFEVVAPAFKHALALLQGAVTDCATDR